MNEFNLQSQNLPINQNIPSKGKPKKNQNTKKINK